VASTEQVQSYMMYRNSAAFGLVGACTTKARAAVDRGQAPRGLSRPAARRKPAGFLISEGSGPARVHHCISVHSRTTCSNVPYTMPDAMATL